MHPGWIGRLDCGQFLNRAKIILVEGELGRFQVVVELLELVAELTTDFEVLIVDDGSTDSTEEVAHEVGETHCAGLPGKRIWSVGSPKFDPVMTMDEVGVPADVGWGEICEMMGTCACATAVTSGNTGVRGWHWQ